MFELDLKENIDFGIVKDLAGVSTSRICGFIVYSLKHANVAKVVRDEDYWNELNAISGPNWPIFCVRPLCAKCSTAADWRKNEDILKYFYLEDTDRDLPCFVLFAWDDNDNLCMNAYHIDDSSVESTHTSLRHIVTEISTAEETVLDEYKGTTSVYRNVSWVIDSLRVREQYCRLYQDVTSILNPLRLFIRLMK